MDDEKTILNKAIKSLLKIITIIYSKKTKITISQAIEFIEIKKELEELGIDINKYLQ